MHFIAANVKICIYVSQTKINLENIFLIAEIIPKEPAGLMKQNVGLHSHDNTKEGDKSVKDNEKTKNKDIMEKILKMTETFPKCIMKIEEGL